MATPNTAAGRHLFTDRVGYSAPAQRNEALAPELLEEHRGIVRDILLKHGGREVKTTGSGFLIEFPSALAAVRCAINVQAALHTRNRAGGAEASLLRMFDTANGSAVPFTKGTVYDFEPSWDDQGRSVRFIRRDTGARYAGFAKLRVKPIDGPGPEQVLLEGLGGSMSATAELKCEAMARMASLPNGPRMRKGRWPTGP